MNPPRVNLVMIPRSHKTKRIIAIVHKVFIVCHFSFADALRMRDIRADYYGGNNLVNCTTKLQN